MQVKRARTHARLQINWRIVVALALLMTQQAAAINEQRPFVAQWSTETYLLPFDDGATRLAIPRNHLENWLPAVPSIREATFTGTALLPAFTGATPETIALFRSVDFLQRGGFRFAYDRPMSAFLDDDGFFRRGPWVFRRPDIELEPVEHGLLGIKGSGLTLRVWLGATDAESVTVGCSERICEIALFAEGGRWRTQIGRQSYPHWREISEALRAFLAACAKAAN